MAVRASALSGPRRDFGWDFASFLKLALPMIVSRAGLATMSIADAVMVSRYDARQFAVFSLAGGTLGRLMDVFGAFLIGGLILIPRAAAAGDFNACQALWRRSLLPAVVLGLLGLAAACFGAPLLRLSGESADLSASAGAVAVFLGWGFAPGLLALCAAIFLEGMNQPVVVAVSVVAANVLNLLLNWLLIGGSMSLPAMGARGSALSTSIVRLALAAALVAYAWRLKFPPSDGTRSSLADAKTQRNLGFSSAAIQGTIMLLSSCLTLFAGWMGATALAVLAAIFTLNAPAMLVSMGMADAASIQVAGEDGRGTNGNPRTFGFAGLAATLAAMILFVEAVVFLAGPLAASFTSDSAVQASLTSLIPLGACLVLLDGASFVMAGALRALRDIAWPVAIEIGSMALLVPVAFGLAFRAGLGVRGLLLSALISAACRSALLMWRFGVCTRQREKSLLAHA